MRTSFPGPTPQARAQVSALMLCLALLLSGSLSGCSGTAGTPHAQAGASASQVVATTPTLRTTAKVGRLVGRLPGPRRTAVRKRVAIVIDRWWEAAYLSGERPDSDVASAFPGFTQGARKRAGADRELMTNADLKSSSITPLMRKVRLDLLSVNKRIRSVTARFELRVRTTDTAAGTRPRRLQIRGRLFLTHQPGGWKVFGYDVAKGWLR